LNVEADTHKLTRLVSIVDRIQLNTVYWKVTNTKAFPEGLENIVPHP